MSILERYLPYRTFSLQQTSEIVSQDLPANYYTGMSTLGRYPAYSDMSFERVNGNITN